ncbi:MAG: N-acetylmuramoyl-L-alanine amidase, partial [Acidobacteriota bacterium]
MTGISELKLRRPALFFLLFLSLLAPALAQPTLRVTAQDYEDYSRVIVTLPSPLSFSLEKDEAFLQIRINSPVAFRLRTDRVKSRFIKSFSWVKGSDFYIVVVEVQHGRFRYDSFRIDRRRQLVVDFYELTEEAQATTPKEPEPTLPTPPAKEEPAPPVASPPVEKPPALIPRRIRTIVIDPGHGGLESGAKGKFGHLEKDITLAVGLKLKSVIEKNLAFHVQLTRDKDIDVTLENRAAMA